MLIDGDGAILGRLASLVAKKLLMGENVIIVNADRVVISGKLNVVESRLLGKMHRGDRKKGPFYPKYPDRIFQRSVRGMLPDNKRGRDSLRRLKVHRSCPIDFKDPMKIGKNKEDLTARYVTLGEVCRKLGAKI